MSSCNCSCSIDTCGESSVTLSVLTPTARKEHTCGECGETIRKGEKYERYTGIGDGVMFTAKTCMLCTEIRDCFCCSYYFGEVWLSIRDCMYDFELCALDSLSVGARNKFFEEMDLEELE